jgi:hypothetical protein
MFNCLDTGSANCPVFECAFGDLLNLVVLVLALLLDTAYTVEYVLREPR